MFRSLLAFALIVSVSNPVSSDIFTPSHSCYEPYKPYEFSSQWELDQFRYEVDSYRDCIQSFVTEMHDAAERHNEAANRAIEDWERFLDTLN